MKITIELLQCLLERGWEIRTVFGQVEFRDPRGMSGSRYVCANFESEFPEAVSEWIRDHIQLVPA